MIHYAEKEAGCHQAGRAAYSDRSWPGPVGPQPRQQFAYATGSRLTPSYPDALLEPSSCRRGHTTDMETTKLLAATRSFVSLVTGYAFLKMD
jgi:hypothetical protein